MLEVGKNIYANFNPETLVINPRQNARALIMGHCGNGKTLFINNMCNTRHRVGVDKGSMTRDIAFEDVVHVPGKKFRIYDTPGSDSSKEALQHALVLRASLTNLPLNLIMIQAKFDCRYEKSLAQFCQQIKIFKGYEPMVVYLLSHGDVMDNQKQTKKDEVLSKFGATLQEFDLNNKKVIIYSNINSDLIKLAKILFDVARCTPPQNIQIDEKTFYKYFKLSSPLDGLKTHQVEEYLQQIKDRTQVFLNFARSLKPGTEDLEQIISQVKSYMKYDIKQLQHQQYRKYEEEFKNDYKTTDVYLMISQFVQTKFEQLDDICEPKIKKVIYDDQSKKEMDIRDMFRKCPNCGQIWIKVAGCNGETTCGNKPNFYDYFRNKDVYSFEFEIKDEKITYKKKKNKKLAEKMTENNQTQQSYFKKNNLATEKPVGCGANINWGLLPRIQNIQSLLKQLYGLSNFQEIRLELDNISKKQGKYSNKIVEAVKKNFEVMKNDQLEISSQKKDKIEIKQSDAKNPPHNLFSWFKKIYEKKS